jgi:membrane protein DedA with SNARE-associated domain
MVIAAIVGDAVNYTIGRLFGEKLFSNPNSKIFRRIPATNGAKVRTIGTKRARIMVFPP